MSNQNNPHYVPDKAVSGRTKSRVIVIGGGQAGLAIDHYLSEAGIDLLILESGTDRRLVAKAVGFASTFLALRSGLPGLPFPGDSRAFPTKDEVADYLEEYARRARLPVRFRTKVEALDRDGNRYVIAAGNVRFEADQVVSPPVPIR
jgi:putative flavoprotein involved in K+ transport